MSGKEAMTALETSNLENPSGPDLPPAGFSGFGHGGYEGGNRGQEQNYGTPGVMQKLAELAVRTFSMSPLRAPERMSEHFGHAEKRNNPTPNFADPRG